METIRSSFIPSRDKYSIFDFFNENIQVMIGDKEGHQIDSSKPGRIWTAGATSSRSLDDFSSWK